MPLLNQMWRNNGNGTFTNQTAATGFAGNAPSLNAIATDYNNDRAVDLVVSGNAIGGPLVFENPREGKFRVDVHWQTSLGTTAGVATLDFDHDGWMDLAFTHWNAPAITLWRNNHGKTFDPVTLPKVNWARAWGIAPIDYDNDGWIDFVAVGETPEGKGEVRLFRNLGPDGFKDVSTDVGLDRIALKDPRSVIVGDYDNDGASDLLITQNHGPAILLRNEGGNKNNWLRLALKGLNDNKSAIGTKVEIFAGANRQKFEIAGSSGYLGQNSPYLTVGLGDAKQADVVRMLWPTGVLQDEIEVAGNRQAAYLRNRPPRQLLSYLVCLGWSPLSARGRRARRRCGRPLGRPGPAQYCAPHRVRQSRSQHDPIQRRQTQFPPHGTDGGSCLPRPGQPPRGRPPRRS